MMILSDIVFAAFLFLLVYLLVISGYMILLTIGAFFYRPKSVETDKTLRFAIIMPAHNEQAVIANTLRDISELDYDPALFTLYVIADNCTDDTAEIASRSGAIVRERTDEANRGKGQALDWFLRQYREELSEFDLIAFIDADMQVERQFLQGMATAFSSQSCQVAQARYTVSADVSNWREAVGFASFAYINHVRPSGKCFWGGTADLKGSGMVFRSELILETGWPMHSIAEDVEFGKELLMRGVLVAYEPRAVVTSHIPSTFDQISVQQSRWEGGKMVVFWNFIGRILGALVRRPSIRHLDAALDLLVPPLSIVLASCVIGIVGSLLHSGIPWYWFAFPIVSFGVAVLTGLIMLRAPGRIWVMLMMVPAFVVWKLVLLAKVAFRRRETQWLRTPRDTSD